MGSLAQPSDNIINISKPKELPMIVLTNYLLAEPSRMPALLSGLEEHEIAMPKVVQTAVTCNLYRIIHKAGGIHSDCPQEVSDAVIAMSFNQINSFVESLCITYIKKIIKNKQYEI